MLKRFEAMLSCLLSFQKDALGDKDPKDKVNKEEGRQAFMNLAGADGEIDAFELQNILNATFKKGRSSEIN